MREDDDRRRVVGLHLRERLLRPGDDDLVSVRQALRGREAPSCVSGDRMPAEPTRSRTQRIRRVDGAVDEEPRRRSEDVGEDAVALELDDPAVSSPDQLVGDGILTVTNES